MPSRSRPILRVTAPFREALLLESGLLQAINLATLIATKASRGSGRRDSKPVAEFALRRAQASHSWLRDRHVSAALQHVVPRRSLPLRLLSTGTVPHALVQLFDTEEEAFEAIADTIQSLHPANRYARRAGRNPYGRRGGARGPRDLGLDKSWRGSDSIAATLAAMHVMWERRSRPSWPGGGENRRFGRPRRILDP